MRWTSIAAVVLGVGLATAADDKPKKELEPFQGNWAVKAITRNGEAVPDEAVRKLSLIVKGNERVVKEGDEVKSKGTFTVDESKKPKQMDITGVEGPNRGKTFLSLYELKDDTLTVCYGLDFKTRPTDLKTAEKSNTMLITYKRKK